MIQRIICLSFIILFGFTTGICLAKYSGGDGSETTPYRISNANDMNDIGANPADWNDCFVLTDDINLAQFTGTQFNIIGPNSTTPFTGIFDGNGFAISNFTYHSTGVNLITLFGKVSGEAAVIKNLGLVGTEVRAGTGLFIGSLVGSLSKGTILNCYVTDCNVLGRGTVGGLVGANSGTIRYCHATGIIAANDDVGGLVGGNGIDGVISDSFATATVSGTGVCAGGLVGGNTGYISNCYATGSVIGISNVVGGFVGSNYGSIFSSYATGNAEGNMAVGGFIGSSWEGTITACYSTGAVDGNDLTGGLTGFHHNSSYTKCFWDSDVNPDVNGIGNTTDPNVIGESTANMQTESTFTSAGWDFVAETTNGTEDIWTIHDGNDYPIHVWPLVNFVGWYEVDLADYAFFSNYWNDTNCGDANDCNGVDLDFSDTVDESDLKILLDHWLTGLQ